MEPNIDSPTPEEPANIVALPGATERRFSAPENFINRELSWLEFNRRVLEEAQDPDAAAARAGQIPRHRELESRRVLRDPRRRHQATDRERDERCRTGRNEPDATLRRDPARRARNGGDAIRALEQRDRAAPAREQIFAFITWRELSAKRAAWARRYFQQEVFPMLTPLAVDASHPFPQLLNKSHNLLVRARAKKAANRCMPLCRCRAPSRA